MAIAYIIYNKKAGDSRAFESINKLDVFIEDEVKYIEITKISDYRTFLNGLEREDYIILAGGDGTLNKFINNVDKIKFDNEVLYFPIGTGNDFARDLGYKKGSMPFSVRDYIKDVPTVTVNGKTYRFINGVGYGLDGYCCEIGDIFKKSPEKKVNYTSIAIKGLLFHYKPTNAKVTVDGKEYSYKKVWIAPTMIGRFYGGGMMPTPDQHRFSDRLSTLIFHNSGKLRTLMIFPSIFKGKHTEHTENIDILSGKEITVEFDRPVSLQIDGETITNVLSYTARR